MTQQRPWLPDEVALLRSLIAERLTYRQVAERLGRTLVAVQRMAGKLELHFLSKRRWTRREDRLLVKWRTERMRFREIAQVLGRTSTAVQKRHGRLMLALNGKKTGGGRRQVAYKARIVLDSVNGAGDRLTTMEVTYPLFVHNEVLTHRAFSRNAASSRAIPIEKTIKAVRDDPVVPVWWGKGQSGMQAREELTGTSREWAEKNWLNARDAAVDCAYRMLDEGAHKQIVNRLLAPWAWITVLVSATEWQNFFALRCHPDAQPELQRIAYMMRDLYQESRPVEIADGDWHLPLYTGVKVGDLAYPLAVKISTGRCARISYLTHNGIRDPQEDIRLHDDLLRNGHMSPFEHVAQAAPGAQSGNFTGWRQYRSMVQRYDD